jgi:hypothetical protein
VASELFSWTVSNIDFPLGPREGIFAEGCNDDCCSPLTGSGTPCFVVPCGVSGGVAPLGVASRTLMLGSTAGADGFVGVEADPDSSTFFPAIELRLVCLGVTRVAEVAGGGLLIRGGAGHCDVVSPGPALFAPAREGSFDTASETAPPVPAESCGTLLAESARCMAAAEGCD